MNQAKKIHKTKNNQAHEAGRDLEPIFGKAFDPQAKERALRILPEDSTEELAQYFQVIVDQSLTGIYVIKGEVFTYVNPRFAQIFGYSQEELISMTNPIETVYEPDRHLVVTTVEARLAGEQSRSNYRYRGLKKDGTVIHVEVFGARVKQKGSFVTMGTLLDVTAQTVYEKKITAIALEMSTLIEQANVPVFGIDRGGYISEWNRATAELTGYSRNEVIGKKWISLLDSRLEERARAAISDVLEGNPIGNWELQLMTKSGNKVVLLISMSPRRDNDKNIQGVVCVAQNITEVYNYRQNLEKMVQDRTRELHEALQKEKELVELKSKFVSIASHEFRTPLSSMTLAAESVRHYFDKLSEEEIKNKMVKIEDQVSHMTHLLDDILTIGKSEAGKINVIRKDLNLKEFVESLLEEIKSTVKVKRDISFIFQASDAIMHVDDKLLRNVINNMMTNALKFSPPDSIVDLSISDIEGDVLIEVADLGIGIPEVDLKNVFEPFQRASNAAHVQGTGLGLSILKKAVELLNGNVEVISAINHGTVVKVRIPR